MARTRSVGKEAMAHTKTSDQDQSSQQGGHEGRMYGRFAAMILTSTVVMYALTYTNLFEFEHAHFSLERVYMAVLMGSAMAIIMLGYMWGMMYRNTKVNIAIVAGALVVGAAAFTASQLQIFVEDEEYMEAMIPHHSIAILTSERSDLDDVRVKELAQGIAVTQVKEIKQMEWLLQDIEENGLATTEEEAEERPIPDFEVDLPISAFDDD